MVTRRRRGSTTRFFVVMVMVIMPRLSPGASRVGERRGV